MVCSYQAVFLNNRHIVNYGFLLIHRSTKTHQFTSIKPADTMHVNNMNTLEIDEAEEMGILCDIHVQ